MVTGIAVAVISFFPGFHMIVKFGNPALDAAISKTPVLIFADPRDCSVQFDPVGKAQFTSPCDLAKGLVTNLGVPYESRPAEPGAVAATVQIGTEMIAIRSGAGLIPRRCAT